MVKKKIETIRLEVEGMTCDDCATHVERALRKVPGVDTASVPDWSSGLATASLEQGTKIDDIRESVSAAGYSVRAVSTDQPAGTPSRKGPYDLVVIGAGSGGFSAAIAAAEEGFQVALINHGTLGGTCVNVGCVPSKVLIRAAETGSGSADWSEAMFDKDNLVRSMREMKYGDVLKAYENIALIEGAARFIDPETITVDGRPITANRFVIAAGARPRLTGIPGVDEAKPLTSTTIMEIKELPESLIVLGGRAVALELGQTMARFGVRVLILQRSERILPEHDAEAAEALEQELQREGIEIVTGAQANAMGTQDGRKYVEYTKSGELHRRESDEILLAHGREPHTSELGLGEAGITIDDRGFIRIDEFQKTSNPHVYAVGDITTAPEFVYVAAAAGKSAARNALGVETRPLDLSVLPAVVFTDPQIATVGLTESEAARTNRDTVTTVMPLEYVPRAAVDGRTGGLVKLVAELGTGRLLGGTIVAPHAGETIGTLALAVRMGMSSEELAGTLFPYLTWVEGLKLAALTFSKDLRRLSCCAG